MRRQAVIALVGLDLGAAARPRRPVLTAHGQTGGDPSDIFTAFLERKNGAAELAKALAGKKLPSDVAKVGVRTVRSSGLREAPALAVALTKAGNLGTGRAAAERRRNEKMVEEMAKSGDPARGEKVFRRADMVCTEMSRRSRGAGGQVGPDLVSIGASAPVDYLVESILLPSKAIKENYQRAARRDEEGQVVTGIKVRETKTELVLRNAEDKEVTIPIEQIESRETRKSR